MNALHTSCIGQQKRSREPASRHSFLLSAVPKVLAVTKSTKTKDVQAAVQHFYKQRIGYSVAHKVLQVLQKKDIEVERDEFRKKTLFPCGHAITVMHRLQRAPIDYTPAYAKRETWIAAYTRNFLSIGLADVELVHLRGRVLGDEAGNDSDSDLSEPPLSDCEPPLTRAPRGRPSNKRKRKGDGRSLRNLRRRLEEPGALADIPDRAPPRCSSCKNLGHYASNCTRPHT